MTGIVPKMAIRFTSYEWYKQLLADKDGVVTNKATFSGMSSMGPPVWTDGLKLGNGRALSKLTFPKLAKHTPARDMLRNSYTNYSQLALQLE